MDYAETYITPPPLIARVPVRQRCETGDENVYEQPSRIVANSPQGERTSSSNRVVEYVPTETQKKQRTSPENFILLMSAIALLISVVSLTITAVFIAKAQKNKDDQNMMISDLKSSNIGFSDEVNVKIGKLNEVISNITEVTACIQKKLEKVSNFTKVTRYGQSSIVKFHTDYIDFLMKNPCSKVDLWTWYTASNGYSYRIFKNRVNYANAKVTCMSHQARLASAGIRDPSVYWILANFVRTAHGRAWIGLTDVATEGVWRYEDGTEVNMAKTLWSPKEPSNSGNSEDCGHIHFSDAMIWDVSCSAQLSLTVCEKQSG